MNVGTPLDDSLSFGLSLAALMIIIYFSTFVGFVDALLIPAVLLLGGFVLQIAMAGRITQDEKIDSKEASSTLKYTLVALIGIMIGSLAIPGLFTPPTPAAIAGGDAVLYVVLFAICEERFFRGGVYTFLHWKISSPLIAIMFGAFIFGAYHLAVYTTSWDKIAYTVVAGFMFGYATWKTNRLTSAKLGHILNNILSVALKIGGS